ncbi:MAG: hypothetical protein U9Q82_03870 [Chloroflexota bacterium]|nr:hypothetical protein [Chloroflexota bacterium]
MKHNNEVFVQSSCSHPSHRPHPSSLPHPSPLPKGEGTPSSSFGGGLKRGSERAYNESLSPYGILLIAILFIASVGLACNTPVNDGSSETQIALNVQTTQLVLQNTQNSQNAQNA